MTTCKIHNLSLIDVFLTVSYSHKSNAINSPPLRLPGEIRNIISGWVFRGVEYGLVDNWRPRDSVVLLQVENALGLHTLHDLNLLLVCRQIHSETALLPYRLGSFDIWDESLSYEKDLQAADRFLKERTQEQIDAISCMRFGVLYAKDGYPSLIEETGAFWVAKLAEPWYRRSS